jgi:hypothetical protein
MIQDPSSSIVVDSSLIEVKKSEELQSDYNYAHSSGFSAISARFAVDARNGCSCHGIAGEQAPNFNADPCTQRFSFEAHLWS